MISRRHLPVMLAIAVASLGTAHAAEIPEQPQIEPGLFKESKAKSKADEALIAVMRQLHNDSGDAPMVGNTDTDFAHQLRVHQQAAAGLAKVELQTGRDFELRELARKIARDAERNERLLDSWIARRQKLSPLR